MIIEPSKTSRLIVIFALLFSAGLSIAGPRSHPIEVRPSEHVFREEPTRTSHESFRRGESRENETLRKAREGDVARPTDTHPYADEAIRRHYESAARHVQERELIERAESAAGLRVRTLADLGEQTSKSRSGTIATIVVMPETAAGFRNSFGSEPTIDQHSQVNNFISQFRADRATLLTKTEDGQAAIEVAVRMASVSNETVIIIAHAIRNMRGETRIVMPDGNYATPEALARVAATTNLVFLTCFSHDLDPNSAIDLQEATAIWRYALHGSDGPSASLSESTPSFSEGTHQTASAEADSGIASANHNTPGGTVANAQVHRRSFDVLVVRLRSGLFAHPRIAMTWTSIDRGDGRFLIEEQKDVRAIGGSLLVFLPLMLGYLLIIVVMIALPDARTVGSLVVRMRNTMNRRRMAIALSGLGMVVIVALLAIAAAWNMLTSTGCADPIPLAVYISAIAGILQAILSCVVARIDPFGSSLAKVAHSTAGFLVGLSGCIATLVFGTIALPFIALTFDGAGELLLTLLVVTLLLLWTALAMIFEAARAAGLGCSTFGAMRKRAQNWTSWANGDH